MKEKERKLHRGFTLIETLIYVSIIGMVLSSFIFFSISISKSRNKTYVAGEVQANLRTAMDIMSQKIRASIGIDINASTFDTDPGVLSLLMADGAKSPTVFNLDQDDGILYIKEGTDSSVSLTSNEVKITNLVFTNLTGAGTRENIRIQMTTMFDNAAGDTEFNHTQSIQTSINVRE